MVKSEVLDASVLIAKRFGLTTIFNAIEYPPAFEKCTIIWPKKIDFERALDIGIKLRKAGRTVPAIDLLTASMCINRNLTLITKDSDYKNIKFVEPKFKFRLLK